MPVAAEIRVTDPLVTHRSNSDTAGHAAKSWSGPAEYQERVARPVMHAIDAMPKLYRDLVQDYGYVDVYRAWKRGISPDVIRARAEANGGRFVL